MPKRKDGGLPQAVATQGGLLATLAVLLAGTASGARAWMVLIKGAIAFLLSSAILRALTAATLQFLRLKASRPPQTAPDTDKEIRSTAAVIASTARSPEPVEKVAS